MKIEHWQSKSPQKYPGRQLDYTNMLGACYGGQKKNKKCPPETHSIAIPHSKTILIYVFALPMLHTQSSRASSFWVMDVFNRTIQILSEILMLYSI